MKKKPAIQIMFLIAALYDGLLGLAFLVAPVALFGLFQVTPPNHIGYVQFPALLLMLFAWMFLKIAREPVANRNLIPFGVGLKVSFCAVVIGHWALNGIPTMWKPFAVADLCFLVLFVAAARVLKTPA